MFGQLNNMIRPILHFVPANRYPAETSRVFFNHLNRYCDVRALSSELTDELIARYTASVIRAERHFAPIPGSHLFPMKSPAAVTRCKG